MDQVKAIFGSIKKYHFWILCVILILVGLTSWYMSTSSLKAETDKNASNIKSKVTEVEAVKKIEPHPNQTFIEGMDKVIEGYSNNLAQGWLHRYNQQKSLLVWPESLSPEFIRRVNPLRPIEDFATFDDKGYVASEEIEGQFREEYRNFITLELPHLAEKIGSKWKAKVGEAAGSSGMSGSKMMSGSKGGAPPKMGYGGSGKSKGKGYGGTSGRSGLGGDEEEEEDDSVVIWDPANQQEILNVHFGLAGLQETPHTLDILYAQEDLWVLDAIMEVIRRTNDGADANYNAAVKQIESIQMGRTVQGRLGQVTMLDGSGGGGGASGMPNMGMMSQGGPSMPSMSGPPSGSSGSSSAPAGGGSGGGPPPGGSGGGPPPGSSGGSLGGPPPGGTGSNMTSTTGPVDPAIGRYVDIDYNPLEPKDLRAARKSEDPKLAIYSVAKRMPVRLRLKIDQRKLNDLLAECGNSSLPIEVRQVRINCPADGSGGSSGGMSGGFGGFGSSRPSAPSAGSMGGAPPGPGSGSGSGGFGGARSMGSGGNEEQADPNEIVVDVFGIVHIYNPVNQKQLNTNLREDGQSPVPPAAPTAAATTPEVTPVSAPAKSG